MWLVLSLFFSFNLVSSWTTDSTAVRYTRTITNRECPDNGGDDKWKGKYFCDPGYFAVGLRFWYEESTTGDDTGGNDARLYCAPLYNWGTNFAGNNPIPSNSPNDFGETNQVRWCPNGEYMTGFKTSDTGSDCSEGTTNINIYCQSSGLRGAFSGNSILDRGGWSSVVSTCHDGEYVCGIEIRYMDYSGVFVNDRSMSAVRLQCCNYRTFTYNPTPAPTEQPTPAPTDQPTPSPTDNPTSSPTPSPTLSPTVSPTPVPTEQPTPVPTNEPTPAPTNEPTPSPTEQPTPTPTDNPTFSPSIAPSDSPTYHTTKRNEKLVNNNTFSRLIETNMIWLFIGIIFLVFCCICMYIVIYCWKSKKNVENKLKSIEMNTIQSMSPTQPDMRQNTIVNNVNNMYDGGYNNGNNVNAMYVDSNYNNGTYVNGEYDDDIALNNIIGDNQEGIETVPNENIDELFGQHETNAGPPPNPFMKQGLPAIIPDPSEKVYETNGYEMDEDDIEEYQEQYYDETNGNMATATAAASNNDANYYEYDENVEQYYEQAYEEYGNTQGNEKYYVNENQ